MGMVPYLCLMGAVLVAPHMNASTATTVAWVCAGIAAASLAFKIFVKDH